MPYFKKQRFGTTPSLCALELFLRLFRSQCPYSFVNLRILTKKVKERNACRVSTHAFSKSPGFGGHGPFQICVFSCSQESAGLSSKNHSGYTPGFPVHSLPVPHKWGPLNILPFDIWVDECPDLIAVTPRKLRSQVTHTQIVTDISCFLEPFH